MKRLSPYIHFLKMDDGNLIILNSYSGKIFRVLSSQIPVFNDTINTLENMDEHHVFVKNQIVIEDNLKEKSLFKEFEEKKDYLHLVLLPTEDCNFRCSYCYEAHNKALMDDRVASSVLLFVENHLDDYDALRIEWFGGEPLFASDIVYELSEGLINICKNKKKPYYASMTTNGYYLNVETFKTLLKYKVVKYQITLDGVAEYHDKQRFLDDGSGTFDTIIENLRAIRDNIFSNFYSITIRSNITSENREKFGDFLDFVQKEFSKDPRFNFLWKIAWDPNTKSCDTYLSQNELKTILNESSARNLNLDTSRRQMAKFGNICYASNKNSFIIGADGSLYKCTVAFDRDINKIGSLLENGEMNIDLDKFRFWTEEKPNMNRKMCSNCYLYPSCLGIYCNLNNQDSDGKFLCSGFKNYIDDYLNCIVKNGMNIIDLEI